MNQERTFEDELETCEALVTRLERGTFGLDEAISLFEEAVSRVKDLQERLGDVESRVRQVLEREGMVTEAPIEDR